MNLTNWTWQFKNVSHFDLFELHTQQFYTTKIWELFCKIHFESDFNDAYLKFVVFCYNLISFFLHLPQPSVQFMNFLLHQVRLHFTRNFSKNVWRSSRWHSGKWTKPLSVVHSLSQTYIQSTDRQKDRQTKGGRCSAGACWL